MSASAVAFSMLFNLLLSEIKLSLCFFLFVSRCFYFLFYSIFFVIPVVNENEKLKLELAIPVGEPKTVANDAIETQAIVADKIIMIYQNSQREQHIC